MGLVELDAKILQIVAEIEGGDFAQARIYVASAQALLAGTPNAGQGENRADFNQRSEELTALRKTINECQSAARVATVGGIHHSKVTYARPTSS